jgi:PAS domain-containing protein
MSSPPYLPLSRKTTPAVAGEDLQSEIALFVESFSEGVIFLDRDWRITFANESARCISRIEPEHLNGASHRKIYPETLGTPMRSTPCGRGAGL